MRWTVAKIGWSDRAVWPTSGRALLRERPRVGRRKDFDGGRLPHGRRAPIVQVIDCRFVGAWRSLVAHQSGGLVVVGSNPAAPTNSFAPDGLSKRPGWRQRTSYRATVLQALAALDGVARARERTYQEPAVENFQVNRARPVASAVTLTRL